MAKKGCGCGGCLAKLLITLVIVVALVGVGGYFGGNYLLKRYVGDNGEIMQLGINNWSDLNRLSKAFTKGGKPAMDEKDKATDQSKSDAFNAINNASGGNAGTEENPDFSKFVDGTLEYAAGSVIRLSGGQMAAILDTTMGQKLGIPAKVEQVKFEVAEGDASVKVTVTLSVSKKAIAQEMGSNAAMEFMLNLFIKGDSFYLTSTFTLDAADGQVAYTQNDAVLLINDLSAGDSQKILQPIAALAGQEDIAALNTLLVDTVTQTVNNMGAVKLQRAGDPALGIPDNCLVFSQKSAAVPEQV